MHWWCFIYYTSRTRAIEAPFRKPGLVSSPPCVVVSLFGRVEYELAA